MGADEAGKRLVLMTSNSKSASETPVRAVFVPLFFILVGAIFLLALSASIIPLNNLIVRYALCPTASAAYFQPLLGGTSPFGMDKDSSGRNVTLYYNYENGNVRRHDGGAIAGAGFVGSAVIGALAGLILYLAIYIRAGAIQPES